MRIYVVFGERFPTSRFEGICREAPHHSFGTCCVFDMISGSNSWSSDRSNPSKTKDFAYFCRLTPLFFENGRQQNERFLHQIVLLSKHLVSKNRSIKHRPKTGSGIFREARARRTFSCHFADFDSFWLAFLHRASIKSRTLVFEGFGDLRQSEVEVWDGQRLSRD